MTDKIAESIKSTARDMSKSKEIRGLHNFISDIRNCPTKEIESKRVNKELANIREKIKKKKLDGYLRKKYIAKIMYMFILGYEVDFGLIEAVNLLSSEKFSEKQMGYLAMGLFLHEQHDMIPLIINSMGMDLSSRSELANCLSLTLIANVGSRETAEQLAGQVQNLLIAQATKTVVKKKAAVCLLHLFRKHHDCLVLSDSQPKLISLLEANSYGFLTAFMCLMLGLVEVNRDGFEPAVPRVIDILERVSTKPPPVEYIYYNLPNPWLQVKLLRFLRHFPPPTDAALRTSLQESLKRILTHGANMKGTVTNNYKNGLHAILFEAIELIISNANDDMLLGESASILGKFIVAKESNIRYLGLEAMAHLATLSAEATNMLKEHQEIVLQALRDPDISIRRRALDLTYAMCDKNSSEKVVAELLAYSRDADFDIREELALKIAILAEKFASNYAWYVDVILQLIEISGDFVSDDIWHRVVRIVTNHEDIQEYAAKKVFAAVNKPSVHESAVKVAGYILGEFGHLIADNDGSRPTDIFRALHSKFTMFSPKTKALLLSTYAKFLNLYPEEQELIRQITEVLRTHAAYLDAEIQQRAVEYMYLSQKPQLLNKVWDVMPPFDEKFDKLPSTTVDTRLERRGTVSSMPSAVTNGGGGADKERIGSLYASPTLAAASPPQPAPVPVAAAAPAAPALNLPPPKNLDAFNLLCLTNDGVLYRDEHLQIGLRSVYQQSFGRLMLYYGNASQSPLNNIQVVFPPHPGLVIQAQDPAPQLGPGLQMNQAIMATCQQEFKDPPYMIINFVTATGQPVSIPLLLPVIATKFMETLVLNKDDFFSRWKGISGPPLEHQVIIQLMGKATEGVPYIDKLLSQGFRMSVLPGVDTNPNNLVAASVFHSASKQVVCLIRVENNPEKCMCRLTIRTFHPQITDVLKTLLVAQLGEALQLPAA